MDSTRPLVLGFVVKRFLMTDDELQGGQGATEAVRGRRRLQDGNDFLRTQPATSPAGFEALVEAVDRYEASAVVVPSMLHFAALAGVRSITETFERATGARVLVATVSLPP